MYMRYLRVEALNLSNTLFDTDKMNVIRGGSLMLRDAILSASVKLCALHISEVRVGAEAAVFRLNSDQPTETEVISSIRSILASAKGVELSDLVNDLLPQGSRTDRDGAVPQKTVINRPAPGRAFEKQGVQFFYLAACRALRVRCVVRLKRMAARRGAQAMVLPLPSVATQQTPSRRATRRAGRPFGVG
jgi:hypothetical protein